MLGCQNIPVGYFFLDPYVVPEQYPLDGADIRVWNIVASKLNLCGTMVGASNPLATFMMVGYILYKYNYPVEYNILVF